MKRTNFTEIYEAGFGLLVYMLEAIHCRVIGGKDERNSIWQPGR